MITYTVLFSRNEITFKCTGHADGGTKDAAGNNLVCAAVSAIAQTCAAGCSEYADFYKEKYRGSGQLEFRCSNNLQTKAIVDAALIGLGEVERQYPEQVQRGEMNGG